MSAQIGAINLITLDFIYSNIDRIPGLGEEVSTDQFTMALGGGPVASLITAARLGAEVRLATCLQEDRFSKIAKELLEEERIPYRSFPAANSRSPVNVTSVMTFRDKDRSFVSYFADESFYRACTADFYAYLKDCAYCIVSSPNAGLFHQLRDAGCRIIYDVGWSEDLNIESLKDVLSAVYLFAPNDKEALKMTGAPDPRTALLRLAEYVEQPVVKLGKDGALLYRDRQVVHVPPAEFKPVDSTGAGDAFLGGVTYGLLQGWDIFRCVELGNYSGGKATTQIGCLTSKGSLKEFEEICKRKQ